MDIHTTFFKVCCSKFGGTEPLADLNAQKSFSRGSFCSFFPLLSKQAKDKQLLT